jgi:ribosome assembly protein 1
VPQAAGEMHLEMCLKDLRELFAKVDLHVSPPLVQFKETLAYLEGGGGDEVNS